MQKKGSKPKSTAKDPAPGAWDTYWKGTELSSTYEEGETSNHILTETWKKVLSTVEPKAIKMLDIASGRGIVASLAADTFPKIRKSITCIDISEVALKQLKKKLPGVQTRVCRADQLPFEDSSFDLVTSQFGIEYAGLKAFGEACRVMRPNGQLAAVTHFRNGGIFEECEANYRATQQFLNSKFIPLAYNMLKEKMAYPTTAPAEIGQRLIENMKPAITQAVAIINHYGRNIAGGTIDRIFTDIARISRNSRNYDRDEVLNWLLSMEQEMEAYSMRMESMCSSSLSRNDINQIEGLFNSYSVKLLNAEPIIFSDSGPNCAWLIHGVRAGEE